MKPYFGIQFSPATQHNGFTLIEALIAILIIALILPVALSAISAALGSTGDAQRLAIATRVAESRLALIIADRSWATAQGSGQCTAAIDGEDADALRYDITTTPWDAPGMSLLTIRVTWITNAIPEDDPRQAILTTIVTAPPENP